MPENTSESYRILVVDDDEILNGLFCAFLGSRGFETISAEGTVQATNVLIKDDKLDLVLLDYQLGDGVGLDLLVPEKVAQYTSMPPVIMISANEDPEFLEACFERGVADYIIKPVNLSLLALKVKSLINSVRLQRIVKSQNTELEKFKSNAEQEETIAKFTYEYLVSKNSQIIPGINQYLQPCSSFSGDIEISRRSPSGDLFFILADATGHGLSAAITIMPVVTIFNSMVIKGFHIQQIIAEINKKLLNDTPNDRFVAAIIVECNFLKKEVHIWNGAMPKAYWIDKGKIIETFPSRHMALGILEADTLDADTVVLPMPESGYLLLHSDGLIEQENVKGEQFGLVKLKNAIESTELNPTDAVIEAIKSHSEGLAFDDDISICSVDFRQLHTEFYSQGKPISSEEKIDPFSWSVKICGKRLANADLPPMVNNFLQFIGMDQKSCQKVFSIISEMVSNGLDHGILKLSSDIKQSADGFMEYFLKREELLNYLTDKDFIELNLDWVTLAEERKLIITCRDSGPGYDFEVTRNTDDNRYSGRGVSLIQSLAREVKIFAPGNFIKAIL